MYVLFNVFLLSPNVSVILRYKQRQIDYVLVIITTFGLGDVLSGAVSSGILLVRDFAIL